MHFLSAVFSGRTKPDFSPANHVFELMQYSSVYLNAPAVSFATALKAATGDFDKLTVRRRTASVETSNFFLNSRTLSIVTSSFVISGKLPMGISNSAAAKLHSIS